MPINRRPPITPSGRGDHPDIQPETGDLRPEAYIYPDAEERDFNARFTNDQTWAANFMERVAQAQSQQPTYVQESVAGQTFGAGQGPYRGFTEYSAEVARLRAQEDAWKYGEGTTIVRDHEIESMSLDEYDRHFDEHGRPKPGVVVEHTTRSVRLDSGIDPASARELRNR